MRRGHFFPTTDPNGRHSCQAGYPWDNAGPSPRNETMDLTILWWVLAVLLIVGGLVGTILPAMPGVPMVFAGLLLAAYATGFHCQFDH